MCLTGRYSMCQHEAIDKKNNNGRKQMNLLELADRVEASEGTDELDCRVHVALLHPGFEYCGLVWDLKSNFYMKRIGKSDEDKICQWFPNKSYMRSLDAAKDLHDAVLPGWGASINTEGHCRLFPPNSDSNNALDLRYFARAETPAAAWVAAILRAKAQEKTDG